MSSSTPDTSTHGFLHLRYSWWSLVLFVVLGVILETGLAFRAHFYMDTSQEIRRLMWRLAHAHGTLLALVNIAFAICRMQLGAMHNGRLMFASCSLQVGGLLVPAGFFLAGWFTYSTTPGFATLLIPPGALLIFAGILVTAQEIKTENFRQNTAIPD